VYQLRDAADTGLAAADKFTVRLATEMKAILGAVGTNESMAALLQNSSRCWDWAFLVRHPATAPQLIAFRAVCSSLRPLP
jgi:hypothetical protein